LYGDAANYYGQGGPQYYPGQTISPQTDAQQQALQLGIQRAQAGSPNYTAALGQNLNTVNGAGFNANPANAYFASTTGGAGLNANPSNSYFQDVMNGNYLNSNPYLTGMYNAATQPMVQQYQQAIAPGIASQFSAAGRFGSSAHQDAITNANQTLAQGLGNTAANIYGNAYGQERGLQQQAAQGLGSNYMNAAGLQNAAAQGLAGNYNFASGQQQNAINAAPGLANAAYTDIGQLGNFGAAQQAFNQQNLNANIARFDYGQNQPLMNLQNYASLLQGGSPYASKSTTTGGGGSNPFAAAIGTGLMGNSLYNAGNESGLWKSLGGMFGAGAGTGMGLEGMGGLYGQAGDYGMGLASLLGEGGAAATGLEAIAPYAAYGML
jgi:hypothetical protein